MNASGEGRADGAANGLILPIRAESRQPPGEIATNAVLWTSESSLKAMVMA